MYIIYAATSPIPPTFRGKGVFLILCVILKFFLKPPTSRVCSRCIISADGWKQGTQIAAWPYGEARWMDIGFHDLTMLKTIFDLSINML